MSNPQAAQQVMIRFRAILDLFDDDDIAAGVRLLDHGSRELLRLHVGNTHLVKALNLADDDSEAQAEAADLAETAG